MTEQRGAPGALSVPALLGYALAALPTGFCLILANLYLLKFSTDVLELAPARVASLLLAARLWDLCDPFAAALSDRTHTRWGRRRPWLVLGALPLAGGFWMLFAAPAALAPGALSVWMGAALLLCFSGFTLVEVPHAALGAELSSDYHQRTRVFAWKRAAFGVGALAAVAAIGWLERAEDPRAAGRALAWLGGSAALALPVLCALCTRERSGGAPRARSALRSALADVLRNPHARLLLLVFWVQQAGVAIAAVSLPYLSEYVWRTPEWTDRYLLALFATSLLGVPLWLRAAPSLDKSRAMRLSMLGVVAAIGALALAPAHNPGAVLLLAALGGLAAAGMDVLGPSLQADAIDWDELRSGERREGAYFAMWALAQKSSSALGQPLAGLCLALIGFAPNAEQGPAAELGLRAMTGVLPACLFALGLLGFRRFALSAQEHARIQRELAQRAASCAH